ncbi:phosphatidylglycerol lysyltransferase domain-containing protein [Bacteroidales bacterium OttesenSCG-928-I14]|nr:phosphatidylglycerol lysyltransferase domain-containing protein [Bacteroidales bacterium OttesenSCG-928-I14]
MLNFKPVTIEDRDSLQSFFSRNTFRNCDFSFSNIFSWRNFYNTTFAIENETLFIRFQSGESPGYLFPLGGKSIEENISRIMDDAKERGNKFYLFAITEEMLRLINEVIPEQFIYKEDRSWFEYIYSSNDLITLVGKKFQQKRNHINKFKRTYKWEYLPITEAIIPDCLELYKRWCKENGGCNSEQSLVEEGIATQEAFANYKELGLIGGALRIDGEILAYSYGQALTNDTFGIHAEKCLYQIDGGFAMMNQQFAEHNCSNYRYINREEDLGYESLRKAKLSYNPEILLVKGWIEEK